MLKLRFTKSHSNRLKLMSLFVLSACLLIVAFELVTHQARAYSWIPDAPGAGQIGPQQLWRPSMRARLNDKMVYLVGESGSGSANIA
ncbi:MAG TPA: hypothetical protein VH186_33325, partial [Chloroflexia bacterium]|nr:hypothetical protein [Chloroflexia bacterium]